MSTQKTDILYEDSHILVCVKPAGIATQSRSPTNPDMVSILKNHLSAGQRSRTADAQKHRTAGAQKRRTAATADRRAEKGGAPYLGLIHRLDQPVRGIMVFAKTPFAAGELSRSLQTGGFGKHYRALVSNAPPKPEGLLENYMAKDPRTNLSRVCDAKTAGAKPARLFYRTVPEPERYFPADRGGTELDILLDTGRHHQIRVQLAAIGCPIIGDRKYGSGAAESDPLCLCSYRLDLIHPKTRKPMTFSLLSADPTRGSRPRQASLS